MLKSPNGDAVAGKYSVKDQRCLTRRTTHWITERPPKFAWANKINAPSYVWHEKWSQFITIIAFWWDWSGRPSAIRARYPNHYLTRKKKGQGHRVVLAEGLEQVEIILDIDEADKNCPCCDKECSKMGEEVTERLITIPTKIKVERTIRLQKYTVWWEYHCYSNTTASHSS